MSSSSRASSGRDERIGRGSATTPLVPLYKRLPHGPHRLDRTQVIRHQRARIYGAMVEAVASSGYQETSVKQVVALAGVSRRSFYEQFANKQECFLATFDLIAQRGRIVGEGSAKSLAQDPTVIIFDEPTRGVDVGTIPEIHAQIRRQHFARLQLHRAADAIDQKSHAAERGHGDAQRQPQHRQFPGAPFAAQCAQRENQATHDCAQRRC